MTDMTPTHTSTQPVCPRCGVDWFAVTDDGRCADCGKDVTFAARCRVTDWEFGQCRLPAGHTPAHWHAGEVDGEGWETPR